MKQMSPQELAEWLAQDGSDKPLLLDVREDWEYRHCRIEDSVHLPMHAVPDSLSELPEDAAIVVICHHGARSFQVAHYLEQNGYKKIYNLKGGLDAWAATVDPSMPTY